MRTALPLLALALAALPAAAAPPAPASSAAARPNIVYILADDLGWKDVGFRGSDIRTPSIDTIAKQGARLEQLYT